MHRPPNYANAYESGESIQASLKATSRSYGFTHSMLMEAGSPAVRRYAATTRRMTTNTVTFKIPNTYRAFPEWHIRKGIAM
ncbi:helix-turn-helix domain-containing protein [Spirillospora sp. NPDC052269]